MKRSTKRTVGWGSGVSIGVTLVVLTFILIVSINSGPMMDLSGQQLVLNNSGEAVSSLAPQAGGDEACETTGHEDGAVKIDCSENE
jgi:hypothetical protein